jgi:alkylresorcinol/alkylpyrone synthase
MAMYILSVGTSVPEFKTSQEEVVKVLGARWADDVQSKTRKIDAIAKSTMVASRNLSMPLEEYLGSGDFTERSMKFKKEALKLAEEATVKALNEAGISANEVDLIIFTTVTGVSVPTIDALLCNKLDFRADVKRVPLFGLGCVAGVAGTARLHDFLQNNPKGVAILISVELCSLTFQLDDPSPSNLIGSLLFGDGASTLVAVGEEHPNAGRAGSPKTIASRSRFFKNSEHIMGWDIGSHGFKLVLDPGVPSIVRAHLKDELDSFVKSNNLEIPDIATWVSHPGGPKVLIAIAEALNITQDDLQVSWNHLKEFGNLSSSSVLFILKDTMKFKCPAKGSFGLMMAMGPGFCAEEILIQW